MKRNVTIGLDENVIHRAKRVAADRGTSLSRMLADELGRITDKAEAYDRAKQRAFALMDSGLRLGGNPAPRHELYDR